MRHVTPTTQVQLGRSLTGPRLLNLKQGPVYLTSRGCRRQRIL
jgi:hypothetical protein